jgi:hypothetical protein
VYAFVFAFTAILTAIVVYRSESPRTSFNLLIASCQDAFLIRCPHFPRRCPHLPLAKTSLIEYASSKRGRIPRVGHSCRGYTTLDKMGEPCFRKRNRTLTCQDFRNRCGGGSLMLMTFSLEWRSRGLEFLKSSCPVVPVENTAIKRIGSVFARLSSPAAVGSRVGYLGIFLF